MQALDLWRHGTHLLADLELKLYDQRHSKANLLRAQAHYEAAFPVLSSLRSHRTDSALEEDVLKFLQQVRALWGVDQLILALLYWSNCHNGSTFSTESECKLMWVQPDHQGNHRGQCTDT